MKRSRLRRTSKKRATQNRAYSKLRKEFLLRRLYCDICKTKPVSHVHHKDGREGLLLVDLSKWMALCFDCHRRVHANPKWARDQGYLI
jgi:5-methylcytosine-specific restriction endonuclease McrA